MGENFCYNSCIVILDLNNTVCSKLMMICYLLSSIIIGMIHAQAATVKEYPDKMTIVFFFTFFITIQSLGFSLILERNPTAWKLKSTVEVAAIVCTVSITIKA